MTRCLSTKTGQVQVELSCVRMPIFTPNSSGELGHSLALLQRQRKAALGL